MACGRKATVTITSSIPWPRRSSTMCSMQGLPTTGTIGFGWFDVSGRNLVPSPPAMTTAFMAHASGPGSVSSPYDCPPDGCGIRGCGGKREPDADPEDDERPIGARRRGDDEGQGGVEDPCRHPAEEADRELVAAWNDDACAEYEQQVAADDEHEGRPGQPIVEEE